MIGCTASNSGVKLPLDCQCPAASVGDSQLGQLLSHAVLGNRKMVS